MDPIKQAIEALERAKDDLDQWYAVQANEYGEDHPDAVDTWSRIEGCTTALAALRDWQAEGAGIPAEIRETLIEACCEAEDCLAFDAKSYEAMGTRTDSNKASRAAEDVKRIAAARAWLEGK